MASAVAGRGERRRHGLRVHAVGSFTFGEARAYRGRHARRVMSTAGCKSTGNSRGTTAATSTAMPKTTRDDEIFEGIEAARLEHVTGAYSQALFSAMQQAVRMGLTINSTWTGGHAKNSMHYKGRAFDAYGSSRAMWNFYNWAATHTHAHELIHGNRFLKDGRRHKGIGGHNGHVHFSI
jgi:hypothetical protein